MVDLNKVCKKSYITAIILSVGFVVGIPCVVFGAIMGQWILMSIGIIAVLLGFYMMPFAWVSFGNKKTLLHLKNLIESDNILSLQQLSINTNTNLGLIRNQVTTLISKRYLTGYNLLANNMLEKVVVEQQEIEIEFEKCPNCGANLIIENGYAYCEYCQSKTKLR